MPTAISKKGLKRLRDIKNGIKISQCKLIKVSNTFMEIIFSKLAKKLLEKLTKS